MLHVFIINSFAGKGNFSDEIRNQLKKMKDIEYLVFNSEYAGHEGILAMQICEMFQEDHIRFYACGGSGTFRNILKSLPLSDKIDIAEVPHGKTNDFQVCFGNERYKFSNIKAMIKGLPKRLDYIETNVGAVHNSISFGFDSKIIEISSKMNSFSIFNGGMIYAIAGMWALFKRTDFMATIEIDDERISGSFEQMTILNGKVIGGIFNMVDETDLSDGLINVIVFPRKNFFRKMAFYGALIADKKKYLRKHCLYYKAKNIRVVLHDSSPIVFNADGELETGSVLTCSVVHHGMGYIVPQGFGGEL